MTENAPRHQNSTTRHALDMPFGATVLPSGGVRFRLWAPAATRIELLLLEGEAPVAIAARREEAGWWCAEVEGARAGTLYRWRIDGTLEVADPASRFNPDGPHGPSQVVDPRAHAWDEEWHGRPWREVVLYEMHVGTFTAEGTYAAAERRLAELAHTGITAIELMPVASFPGRFGWGYDGVLPFAPFAPYGTPEALKSFIGAAHRLGLMVFLDVVYNHFGPDGNYLGAYAPQFFSPVHRTPWGNALNFDAPGSGTVRSFFIDNALYWLEEYRFDGLRLDAVHAIVDDSPLDVIDELAAQVHRRITDRQVHLVLENENNVGRRLRPGGRYDAQWNDDFHHAMHVVLTGETGRYFHDYRHNPVELVARALTRGFLWEGSPRDTDGHRRSLVAAAAQALPAMVNFVSNHDQSGNRALGERIVSLMPPEAGPLALALTLLSPATPMLFAGEEFGARTPFLYFADWEGELRRAVTEGRQREFGHSTRDASGSDVALPDPCSTRTFEACKLDWAEAATPGGVAHRALVRDLLEARRRWLVPRAELLSSGRHEAHMLGACRFALRWRFDDGVAIELRCHLGADKEAGPAGDAGLPWPPLLEAEQVFAVNLLGNSIDAPWSGRWMIGRERQA